MERRTSACSARKVTPHTRMSHASAIAFWIAPHVGADLSIFKWDIDLPAHSSRAVRETARTVSPHCTTSGYTPSEVPDYGD